jgi:hypothetical protein
VSVRAALLILAFVGAGVAGTREAAALPCAPVDIRLNVKDAIVVEGRVSNVELEVEGVTYAWAGNKQVPVPVKHYKAHVLITDVLRGEPEAHGFYYRWRDWQGAACPDRPVRVGETWIFTLSWWSWDAASKLVYPHTREAYEAAVADGKLREPLPRLYPPQRKTPRTP